MTPCGGCPDRGMCCRYVELPLAVYLNDDSIHWLELHWGLSYHLSAGRPMVRITVPCSALEADGCCRLYGRPERPEMCTIWPDDPKTQAPEGCVYLEGVT